MLFSALIFGLLGSFHCMGMCGPIAFMLPISHNNKLKSYFQISLYHLGRIFSYATLGAVFGILGKGFYFFGMQQKLSIIMGVMMIAVVLLPNIFKKINVVKPFYKLTAKLKNALGYSLKRKENSTFFTIGFLNGLLPCGLVYMAVFGALTTTSILEGMLYMSLFGLGTVPLMTSVVFLGSVTQKINRQKIQKVIPIFVVVIGLLFVFRGLGLDIPFLSPKPIVNLVDAAQSCH